jgi:hypothetical protein
MSPLVLLKDLDLAERTAVLISRTMIPAVLSSIPLRTPSLDLPVRDHRPFPGVSPKSIVKN